MNEQKNAKSVELLNEYVKLKWKELAKRYSGQQVAVYGTKEYCHWLHGLT